MKKAPVFILAFVLGLIGYHKFESDFSGRSPETVETLARKAFAAEKEGGTSIRILNNSWFETEYGVDGGTVENDLRIISTTITESQTMIKDFDTYFIPDNHALTAFLSGKNRDRLAWINPNNKAISADGELLDRHGTPLFFHRESAIRYQVRSAGRDRVMWTSDDVLYPGLKVNAPK